MKRALLSLGLGLSLAACGAPGSTPGAALQNETLNLGTRSSVDFLRLNRGTWNVEDAPAWLHFTPTSGTGYVQFKLDVDRAAMTPTLANQPNLTGSFDVHWQNGTQEGTVTVKVNADLLKVTGRATDQTSAPLNVTAPDARVTRTVNAGQPASARGIIVKYRTSALAAQAIQAAGRNASGAGRLAVLRVSDVNATLKALRADPNVEYAVPNAVLHALNVAQPVIPTDQYAPLQWAYRAVGYGAVWRDMDTTPYSHDVTVAVLDSGTHFNHPDLVGRQYGPGEGALDVLNYTTDKDGNVTYDNGDGDGPDTDPTDAGDTNRTSGSHGTHVTGIIAARWGTFQKPCATCSDSGVAGATGTAPVKVLPVRVLDSRGDGTEADVALGIRYAAGESVTLNGQTYTNPHPAQVINLSLGGPISAENARPMCEAVSAAAARGVLVFAASGNDGNTSAYYPAACDGAIAVASVTLTAGNVLERASYSNAYPQVQLSAPGGTDPILNPTTYNGGTLNGQPFIDSVFSTSWNYRDNLPSYEAESGTSQATPQVSALAALLLSKGVTTGRDDTLARLKSTATDLGPKGHDDQYGYGVINAAAALGAPIVSNTFGVRFTRADGHAYTPVLDDAGRFTAYLPEGTYRALVGHDRNGNRIIGEVDEGPTVETEFTLDPNAGTRDLGELLLK
ncbi:S8 family serine peptidase [Deinococcus maricopensis]|uniref:Peptidase S8 and S53 subtilisin kexin sedolisin n=1 Tax=Deinococcus maricopensis (strain DSM 21211 / LMG 22137 / NRRL B-23946 / LB-34) TaxID=709986 RepID=E8UBR3_DEIML|nr:S8 family serine peptidase [Deinococcus maricopensis]ADV68502.1 peptidase S8 and S53 subtilisin kexin sedolisin [Deinococcus maricopensis DSM 21211]